MDIILLHIIAALDFVNGDFFESIYEEHSDRAYKIAYDYVNHTEDAKEIVQDTFLKVYRHIKDFRGLEREEIIGMIVIYTMNTSLDFLRKKARRIKAGTLTYEDEDEVKEYEIPDDQDTPEEVIIKKDIEERLGKYVGLLPDSQREVIMLKYYYSKKDKEIAEILNIDESAVSSRLNRAKAKLREMIGGGADEQDFKNR
ncbi:MAG: sigma-70 family RNA polymerase sigma factor [Clostridia bacterium]|nr:sigma-70 family RNA polymerase sigma factor [Clostridia bacterium]